MKNILVFLIFTIFCGASELDPNEINSQKEGLDRWNRFADEAMQMPPDEAFKKLGEGIRKTSRPDMYSIEGTKEVAEKLKTSMIKIPGHSEFYKNKILNAQERAKTLPGSLQYYLNEVNESIGVLNQLPSPETIRVLGDFLSDEWKSPNVIQSDINRGVGSMAHYAVYALAKLPLLNKPADTKAIAGEAERDLRTWQLWYAQIKAGTRTFRFEGDPNEYTLAGPVTKEDAKRRDHEQQRDAERTGAAKKATGAAASSPASPVGGNFPKAGMIAGAIVALSLAWYFLRKRKAT